MELRGHSKFFEIELSMATKELPFKPSEIERGFLVVKGC